MQKAEALEVLGGGSVTKAAAAIGITPSAVSMWPDELSPAIRDRVQAALWRRQRVETATIAPPQGDTHDPITPAAASS